jgi:hypothetical protein
MDGIWFEVLVVSAAGIVVPAGDAHRRSFDCGGRCTIG